MVLAQKQKYRQMEQDRKSKDKTHLWVLWASLVAQRVNNPPAMRKTYVQSGLRRFLGGGYGNPLQYSCLENPHGQRSLVGYRPWGHKESDMAEQLSTWVPYF